MKKVYIGMSADVFHHGHINIISEARKYGEVIIGLLSDKAVADHKRLPYLSWKNRKIIIENIKGVVKVFEQQEWDYAPTILKYKPKKRYQKKKGHRQPFTEVEILKILSSSAKSAA